MIDKKIIICSTIRNVEKDLKDFFIKLDEITSKFDDYFNFIADEGIFIGTDASERWSKAEFINFSKPYFDKGKAWSFTSKEPTIRLNHDNKIAWFDEILDTWMGPCRSSGVLRKNKDDWQLEHYQLSITIDNELMPKFLEINNI